MGLMNEDELDDDLNAVEVGDIVDVDIDELGIMPVRVLKLVDDVDDESGIDAGTLSARDRVHNSEFSGPGFVGEPMPESGESGEMVFSMSQVLPGSKMKGYFPDMEDDDWGRETPNPYKNMARKFAGQAINQEGKQVTEAKKITRKQLRSIVETVVAEARPWHDNGMEDVSMERTGSDHPDRSTGYFMTSVVAKKFDDLNTTVVQAMIDEGNDQEGAVYVPWRIEDIEPAAEAAADEAVKALSSPAFKKAFKASFTKMARYAFDHMLKTR